MKFSLKLVSVADDGGDDAVQETVILEKDCQRIEQLGMTLAESKTILRAIQKHIVEEQVSEFLSQRTCCEEGGTPLGRKGHHKIPFRNEWYPDVEIDETHDVAEAA